MATSSGSGARKRREVDRKVKQMADKGQDPSDEQRAEQHGGEKKYFWDEIAEILEKADFGEADGEVDPSEFGEPDCAELRAANLVERAREDVAEMAADQARWAMEALRHWAVVGFEHVASDARTALTVLRACEFLRAIIGTERRAARSVFQEWLKTNQLFDETDELLEEVDELLSEVDEDYEPDQPTPEEAEEERVDSRRWTQEGRELDQQVKRLSELLMAIETLRSRIRELNPRAAEWFDRDD